MISIICPIYNEEKYIDGFIRSILQQDYPKDDMEVLLVDGMSTDRTRDIVHSYSIKYPFIRLVDNTARIVPPAMNIGIHASKGDVIIRMDAHAIFPADYLSELVVNLSKLNADNVGGVCRTLPANDSDVGISIANVLGSSFGMGNSYFRIGAKDVMQVDTVPFGCFHRELFNRIGFFDEELVRNQDDEFNGRIIKNGGKIYLLPHLVIDYFARDTVGKVYRMFNQYGLFKPLVNVKLGSPATVRQFFPLAFVLGLLSCPFIIFTMFVLPWSWARITAFSLLTAYLFVIALYFLLATYFSLKDTKSIRRILIQDWVYFVVHFGYGFGYLQGLFNLLFSKKFMANVNR